MYLFFSLWALLLVTCGVFGDEVPVAAPQVPASTINPYYANRNPVYPGYNPYYNSDNTKVPILSYSSNQGIDGSYSFSFSTGDGKQAQETGFLKDAYVDNTGAPQGTQVKEGSFSYISPEGTPIQVSYVADENGFRPAGIQFSTDGRNALPAPLVDGVKGSQIYDPRFNLNDPRFNLNDPRFNLNDPRFNLNDPRFNLNNPYNRNRYFGQYNSLKPYDPRYPYDQRFDFYNPHRVFNKVVKDEVKKETA